MRNRAQKIILPMFAWVVVTAAIASAQQNCPPPPLLEAAGSEANLFSPQQELELGEIVGQQVSQEDRVIEDGALTSRLSQVGGRLVAAVGSPRFPLRFYLFDLPVANGFSLPGGRIYISRKIVAMLHNDDELAGLLGHEIGHELAGHPALEVSRTLRQALGVTALGDRSDIEQKYFDLMEAERKKSKAFRTSEKQEEAEQRQADAIGLYAMAAAGYDPQAVVNFWDRFAETHGNTGSWLTDLFGTTRPEARRLREMLRDQASLPASCAAPRVIAPLDDFRKWQANVIGYTGLGHPESVHSVSLRRSITPPLPQALRRIRFSPDAKYLLAQDDASVFVLSRQPFQFLFRADAPDAFPAQFSADSQSIVFYTKGLRVETWDIATRERSSVYEITLPERSLCLQSEISVDGKYIACVSDSFNLMVYSVEAGALVYEKKDFCTPTSLLEYLSLLLWRSGLSPGFHLASVHFSPDGKYLVAGTGDGRVEAVELDHFSKISLPGSIKKLLQIDFAFLGPDRLVGVNLEKPDDSAVVQFPSGEHLSRLLLGDQSIEAASKGDYLFLRPVKDHRAGILDIRANKVISTGDNTALDIYGDTLAAETRAGLVGLYAVDGGKFLESASLPQGPLGTLTAFDLSKNLRWLALSGSERGGVWDLKTNERILFVRGFHGAYFADDGLLYSDFEKKDTEKRSIAKMDLLNRQIAVAHPVEEKSHWQTGPFLVVIRPTEPSKISSDRFSIEVRDTRTDALLWKRDLRGSIPMSNTNGDTGIMVLAWHLSDSAAKDEIKRDRNLAARFGSIKMEETNYLIEAIDAATGRTVGGCVVDTGKGSFRLERIDGTTNRALAIDTRDRILVYSLSTGELVGRVFGQKPTISAANSLLTTESEPGKLSILDLETLRARDEFSFSSRIAATKFNDSGTQLFVLTADQAAFVLDVATTTQGAANALTSYP